MNNEKYEVELSINTKPFERQMQKAEKLAETGGDYIEKYLQSIDLSLLKVAPTIDLTQLQEEYNKMNSRVMEIHDLLIEPSSYGFTQQQIEEMMAEREVLNHNMKLYEERFRMLNRLKGEAVQTSDYVKRYFDQQNIKVVRFDGTETKQEINEAIAGIEERMSQIRDALANPFNKSKEAVEKLNAEYKVLNRNLQKYEELLDDSDEKGNKGLGGVFKIFDNGIKKVKRFTMTLLGVRTGYLAISKAMHTYMQNDQELSDKMQSIWTALGVVLAPVVEYIADLVLTLSKYVLYVANALTGIDLLERALNKTQKQLNKSLSSMDEITNLSEQSSLATLKDMLEKIDIDTSWADELTEAIRPIYEFIKGIVDFSIKHPEVLAVIFGGFAVSKLIGTFAGIGSAFGLAGVYGLLLAIGAVSLVALISALGQIEDAVEGIKEATETFTDSAEKFDDKFMSAFRRGELTTEQITKGVNEEKNSIQRLEQQLQNLEDTNYFGKNNSEIEKTKQLIEDARKRVEELTGQKYEIEIDVKSRGTFENMFNNWKKGMNTMFGFKFNTYDVGTNYVPNDQLAMIHEGEAIVPKKFNNKEFLSGSDNSETNELLYELIRIQSENSNKTPVFEMDGREFAKATYKYYKGEENRLGISNSVRRG